MSMYLPNPDLHPTGDEPAEFLEIPPMGQSTTEADTAVEQVEQDESTLRADVQTQVDPTGSA